MSINRTALLLAVLMTLAGAFAASMTWEFMPRASAQNNFNCDDFTYQEEAQAVLDRDPSDPNGLDGDNDGIACEELPRRGGGEPPVGGTPAPVVATGDLDCADFATREEAQAVFESDPSDPNGLDADDDGIACEEFPGEEFSGEEFFGEEVTEVTTADPIEREKIVTSGKEQVVHEGDRIEREEVVTSDEEQEVVRGSETIINIPSQDLPATGGLSVGLAERAVVWIAVACGALMLASAIRRGYR